MGTTREEKMVSQITKWGEINSCSYNLPGLLQMKEALVSAFHILEAEEEEISHPPLTLINSIGQKKKQPSAPTLHYCKRKEAKKRVLLVGHYDTVYPPESPFQTVKREGGRLLGPGVADMKGGLSILLQALFAFESEEISQKIGWDILLNPDEEIGSPASLPTLLKVAKKCQLGLVFEPALPNGALVSERKGSLTLLLRCYGVASHAGRDFHAGKNAIVSLAKLLTEIHSWNGQETTWNVGTIHGGEAANVVADFAFARLSIRSNDLSGVDEKINSAIARFEKSDQVRFEVQTTSLRPPKKGDRALLSYAKLPLHASGGATDGSNLEESGLPTIDSLGCVGGGLHSQNEYLEIASLEERTKLTEQILRAFAQGKL